MGIKTSNTKLLRVGSINVREEIDATVVSGNFTITTKVISWFGGFITKCSETKARLMDASRDNICFGTTPERKR